MKFNTEILDKYRKGLELTELEAKAFVKHCRAENHGRFIYDKKFRVCVPSYLYYDRNGGSNQAHNIISDMDAYKSPLDNTYVEGRAAHREHQIKHGVVECGDAKIEDFTPKKKSAQSGQRRMGHDLADAFAKHGF